MHCLYETPTFLVNIKTFLNTPTPQPYPYSDFLYVDSYFSSFPVSDFSHPHPHRLNFFLTSFISYYIIAIVLAKISTAPYSLEHVSKPVHSLKFYPIYKLTS